ncbi:MAG: hypothetical protein ACUVYA_09985 [Planctomycetota bacterium]
MRGGAKKGWRWRVEDRAANDDLGLLYEPGNWGDVLKGVWAVRVATALAASRPGERFVYLDPFAGAPTYPLVEASRSRLEAAPPSPFVDLQRPYAARGRMASTALLVRDAVAAAGGDVLLRVFDADPKRLEAWKALEGTEAAEGPSGEAVLARAAEAGGSPPDLVLVDPYDLFLRWKDLVPPAARAARRSAAILYLYNKAPRGPGQARLYADFRSELARELRAAEGRALLGRVPADATVARAYHEVVLLGPATEIPGLEEVLARDARDLAEAIARRGAFEVLEVSESPGA